MENELHL